MPHDQAYLLAEKKIEQARHSGTKELILSYMSLTELPESLGLVTELQSLDVSSNKLTALPASLADLKQLHSLNASSNKLTAIPEWIGELSNLYSLNLFSNQISLLPESMGLLTVLFRLELAHNKLINVPTSITNLDQLQWLYLSNNLLTTLPESFGKLSQLQWLDISHNRLESLPETFGNLIKLDHLELNNNQLTDLPSSIIHLDIDVFYGTAFQGNPLNPELAEAYKQGIEAVKTYLHAKAAAQITLNEAKLILVGEGEVGKSCLLSALRDEEFIEGLPTTHGIEIKEIKVIDSDSQKEIMLNGWDFGGQRVYRPTHQLFFSSPAVYLVVWKPREGSQAGQVKEWIRLVKHREPSAKIIVVATHGGPSQRQPDIDRQELWDIFGKDTLIDFFHVDSKPDEHGNRKNTKELKQAIARVAVSLPEVGRSVPKRWQEVREALQNTNQAYLPLEDVMELCRAHGMEHEESRLFITIEHRLGHLIHYEHDPALQDIVVLKPDWLATAISFVLDDEQTRKDNGLVAYNHLHELWDNPKKIEDFRYPPELHPIFLRLMERFDLSYRIAGLSPKSDHNPVSLIAQLVPDIRPNNLDSAWSSTPTSGDVQQIQICRIVDDKGQSATAEGLFYQLIVRLHKYSLGRLHYNNSVHWQRGLILDDDYNGRALMENIGNDVRITVRAPYPERFLAMLTAEVKYLVESFWEGLYCDVMVPCTEPCGRKVVGTGLYEVEKLIDSKRKGRPEFPCPVCNEWQNIDALLRNAPAAAQPISLYELMDQFDAIKGKLDEVNDNTRRILSQVDKKYDDLIQVFTDEAKEGPRLFSLFPLDGSKFNPKNWVRHQFRLVLWCEHSRLPLPVLNNGDMKKGVYDLELEREWFKKAAPYLKLLTGTLSLVFPIASSTLKVIDDTTFKTLENQIDLGKDVIDAITGEAMDINKFMIAADSTDIEHGVAVRAENATIRELHARLKAKDAGFGGLVRVMNKRQEFLWVHEKFASEY